MASVAHPVPSRMSQNVAALFGHADDTLVAWQRFCAQAAEALRPQHDPERLTKALALAQGGHVVLEDDGYALVTSGTTNLAKASFTPVGSSADCIGAPPTKRR